MYTKKCELDGYLYDFIPRTFNPNEKIYIDKYVSELDKYKLEDKHRNKKDKTYFNI